MSTDDWSLCVGGGWRALLDGFFESIEKFDCISVTQVKEKFGGLRIYFDHDIECESECYNRVWDMADLIERVSFHTCEQCGGYGKRRAGSWIKTLCDECNRMDT